MAKSIQPIEKSVDIGDLTIPCLFYEGKGPFLVMLHATGFLPWLWHPIARELTDSFRIICPFFCDHRQVDPKDGGVNWLLLAEDLKRLCEVLDIQSSFMVGHSMGGAIIAIANGNYGLNIEKMILIEPIFLPRDFYNTPISVEEHPLAGSAIKRRNSWKDAAEARAYLKSKPLFQNWDNEMLDLYIDKGMVPSVSGGLELVCHPVREAALFMGSMGYDPWPILPKIKCPVLVLEGEKTENKGIIDFRKASESVAHGDYKVVSDAGHLIPMEKPAQTAEIIKQFFNL